MKNKFYFTFYKQNKFIKQMQFQASQKITPANCRDGPRYQRSYTDCFCFILYILYCIALIIVGILYNHQSIYGHQRPFDYDHNICLGNYPILYMPTTDITNTVCVATCPVNKAGTLLKCQVNSRYPNCTKAFASLTFDRQYNICHGLGIILDNIIEYNFVREALNSINVSKNQLLATAGITCLVSLIMLILTFIFPALMTYIYFILLQLLLAMISTAFIYRYIKGYLPFVDQRSDVEYKNSWITLLIGILFGVGVILIFIILILKRKKFKYIVYALKIAKKCFWQNPYMVFISILYALIAVGALVANFVLLYISTSIGTIQSTKHVPFGQFKYSQFGIWYSAFILFEFIWTHGILVALAEFTFQSIAVTWYFNEKKQGINYSRMLNFSQTCNFIGRHIGTICYGWILSWIPQTIISQINKLQQILPRCYKYCCCLHNCCCKFLSIYGYIETILQSQPFIPACQEMFYLRKRGKNIIPNLYMVGNFYLTAAKIFIEMLSIVFMYVVCIMTQPDTYQDVMNLIVPLLLTWLISAQISTIFLSSTGIVADTISLMYCADLQMQKYGYGGIDAYSCPKQIRILIRQSKAS